ncbi:MAG: mucoidy inhibitor MuiA family protein [Spirochaetes bacterium]|nr:mucoidy inhibitor MuiA family protein [Spirochaetota bacterium]
MKIETFFALSGMMALANLFPLENEELGDARALPSRIAAVTVYADRAQVTRSADFEPGIQPSRLAFSQLPGWIDESSLRVLVTPPEAAQVLDVQVLRHHLARVDDEEFRKAEEAVRQLGDQIAALEDERAVLASQEKQLDSLRLFAFDKLPRDLAVREVKPAEYGEALKFFSTRLLELSAQKRLLEQKKRALQPELAARQRRLDELKQRAQLEQRSVVVTVSAGKGKAALSLVYLLPGATWQPGHELRAAREGASVSLTSFATIMQTSGEDWAGVELSLGTQRTTATMRIPELESLFLGSGRKVGRVVSASAESFGEASQQFASQNIAWFNSRNADLVKQKEYRMNTQALSGKAREVEKIFEGFLSRGTTALFPAIGAQTVRFDGRPVRAPLGKLDLAAVNRILAAPEVSANAARVVELTLTGKQALLPGKVSLYLDGAFLGLTETDFVAPGESFSLYLGVADEIKLSRVLDKKRSELKRSGARTRVQASFLVTVENLGEAARTVQLTERIPVSENDEVKVSGVKIAPDLKPDAKGLLRWDLALPGRQTREFRIEYAIEYPSELPERRRDEKGDAAPLRRLNEQIRGLEKDLK